jgi:D-amino-acid dehydrogenase
MKIAIIGAGAIGVTTAHALSGPHCMVHVYEQGSSAAQGASFAHFGALGPASVQPLFDDRFMRHWLRSFFGKPFTLHWRKLTHVRHYRLMANAFWHSRRRIRSDNEAHLAQLAQYSDSVASIYLSIDGVTFEQGTGLLALHTSERSLAKANEQAIAANQSFALTDKKILLLTPEQARAKEPSLNERADLLGAVFYPDESYGNCALFTKQLKRAHESSNVQYFFNKTVTQLESYGGKWRLHARSNLNALGGTPSTAPLNIDGYDAVVIAAGLGSTALMHGLGIEYPVISTHAYCLALPIKEHLDAPRTSVLDVSKGTRITPIGLAGKVQAHGLAYKALNKLAQHWFPFASKSSEATHETSASCVAIDSKPIIGATHLPGLFLNFAHGPHHWALSFGSAQALADTILNQHNDFDLKPFSPQRFT